MPSSVTTRAAPSNAPPADRAGWASPRRLRKAALIGLMILMVLRIPWAGTHIGLARDAFTAWRLLHGIEFPLYGPVLNDTIHLGPVWFYVVAGALAVGRSWMGMLLVLGALASLQIPLAYRLGKLLHSRSAGLLFAAGLLVPSWMGFEWLLPSHPLFSAPLVLLFLLLAVRYHGAPTRVGLCAMALVFALALHAHPANAGLAWIGIALVVRGTLRGSTPITDVVLAAVVALLPLLPFLVWDALHGFAELHKAIAYLGNPAATGHAWAVGTLFNAVAFGGTLYWFDPTLGWTGPAARMAVVLVSAGGLLGAAGFVRALSDPRWWRTAVVIAAALLCILVTTAALRDVTPYYMTASSRVVLTGMVAFGLAALGDAQWARSARALVVVLALGAFVAAGIGMAQFQRSGNWRFTWVPLFDVKGDRAGAAAQSLLLMPAYAERASGRFLCAQKNPSVHGMYASLLLTSYAMPMRLACASDDVHLGGSEPGRPHWLGLSRSLLARCGVAPVRTLGPLALVPARPLAASPPLLVPEVPRYPPYVPHAVGGATQVIDSSIAPHEHVAVSNTAAGFADRPEIVVRIGGRIATPLAEDSVTRVYACLACSPGPSNAVQLTLTGGDAASVDIVAF